MEAKQTIWSIKDCLVSQLHVSRVSWTLKKYFHGYHFFACNISSKTSYIIPKKQEVWFILERHSTDFISTLEIMAHHWSITRREVCVTRSIILQLIIHVPNCTTQPEDIWRFYKHLAVSTTRRKTMSGKCNILILNPVTSSFWRWTLLLTRFLPSIYF